MIKFYIVNILLLPSILFAQKNDQIIIGLKAHYGSIFIHTPSVKNVAGSKPYGAEIEFSRQPTDTLSFNNCNCFPRNGIAISYFDFDTHILGHGAMLSYFLEPSYKINDNLQFNLRGAAGLTYVSNPYNVIKNPENKNYTTHINPYLQAGISLSYNLNKKFRMLLMSNFQHFSNGAFKEPNRGVNWITGSAGLLYFAQNSFLPKYHSVSSKLIINKKLKADAGILFVPMQGYNSKIMAQSKFIGGTFVQATKQYGRVSALTGGIEVYYNKIEKQTGEESRWIAGLHAGHAFLFGRVTFSQQIGYNIYNQTPGTNNKYYLRYGLLYRITNHLLAGINLKAHADNADFTDFRIMYRF